MHIGDFTCDDQGAPEQYTVQEHCNRIRIIEKDLTVPVRARARIYLPPDNPEYIELQPGEWSPTLRGNLAEWKQGVKAFAMETVNVASAVFSVVEDIDK